MDTAPPAESFSASFDIVRLIMHPFSALKRAFPVLFVGGFIRMCTEGGGGGGNSSLSGEDTDKLIKMMNQQSSAPALPRGPFAWLQEAGSGVGGNLPPGFEELFGGLSIGILFAVIVLVFVLMLVLLMVRAWVTPGWIRNYAEVVRTGDTSFATLFGASDVFARSLGWTVVSLLGGVVWMVVMAVGWLPVLFLSDDTARVVAVVLGAGWTVVFLLVGLWVWLGVRFVDHAIALDELPLSEAIAYSWSFTSGNRLWLLLVSVVLAIVSVMVALPGYCLCCFGIFLTMPISFVLRDFGLVEGYLRQTRGSEIGEWDAETW